MRHGAGDPRSGFGTYYLASLLALALIGGTTFLGWLGTRHAVVGQERLEEATDLRIAGESWLALGMACVQQWANREGGPLYQGKPLVELFRGELLAGGAVDLDLDPGLLGAGAAVPTADRFELVGGRVALRILPARPFGSGSRQGVGHLVLSVRVRDRRGEHPTMRFRVEHAYTVTVPTVPRPFDELMLVVRTTRGLVGDHDGAIQRFMRGRGRVRRELGRILADLEAARARSGTRELDPAIEAVRQARASLPRTPAPALASYDGSEVVVAYPAPGRVVDLGKLAVAERVRELEARVEAAREAEEAADARMTAAVRGLGGRPGELAALAAAVRDWVGTARTLHDLHDAGLAVFEELHTRVHVLGGAFAAKLEPHWGDFTLGAWREKAHYVVKGGSSEELARALQELGREVRPLNGVVYLENAGKPVTLAGADHGLEGRYVLVAEGPLVLDGFRAQAGAGAGGRSRALVVAGGELRVRGAVEAALHPRAGFEIEDGTRIAGALYLLSGAAPNRLAGTLGVLADPGPGAFHRFQAVADGAAGPALRPEALFVAIDPQARAKEARHG